MMGKVKSLKLLLVLCFIFSWLINCKKPVDGPAQPGNPTGGVTSNNGKVLLPVDVKTNNITIVSGSGSYAVTNGEFKIVETDTTSHRIYIAKIANSDLVLLGINFSGESKVEISASSTALALLMINPLVGSLSELDKRRLANGYKKNNLFPSLVKELEETIKLNKDYLVANSKVIEVINKIQGSTIELPKLRKAAHDDIKIKDERISVSALGNVVIMQNKNSFLPYYAGVYDDKGTLLARKDLGETKVSNLGLIDFFINTAENFGKALNCFDFFGTKAVTDCNTERIQFGKPEFPASQEYSFPKDGKYTIKVVNPAYLLVEKNELSTRAAAKMAYLSIQSIVGALDPALSKKIKFDDCYVEIASNYLVDILKFGLQAPAKSTAYELIKSLLENVLKYKVEILKCMSENQKNYVVESFELMKKFTPITKGFDIGGVALNTFGMGYNLLNDKNYFEYCVNVKDKVAEVCGGNLPAGDLNVSVKCYDATTYDPLNTIYSYSYDYVFKVNFENQIVDYPYKSLYLISPSGKTFMPLSIDQKGIANIFITFSPEEVGLNTGVYSISDINDYSKVTVRNSIDFFRVKDNRGIYKAMVVMSDSPLGTYNSKVVVSNTIEFTTPFFNANPCQYVSIKDGYTSTFKPTSLTFSFK